MKIPILLSAIVLACLPLATVSAAPAQKPNILFIAVDDLNDWVGPLGGHPQTKTPNMDRLAKRGTTFANAHCQAPLCNPSRTSLLTSLRSTSTGIYGLQPSFRNLPELQQTVTLPQHLATNGYFTFAAGKIFHDGAVKPKDRANEVQVWGAPGPMPYPPKKIINSPDTLKAMDWGIFPENDEDQADWKIASSAIEQLKNLPPGKPFFVAAGFRLPHVPCFASKKWFDLFPEDKLIMPPVKDNDRDDVPDFAWYLHWKLPEPRLSWLKQANEWRPLVRAYLASIAFMDSQIGRILDALDATGQADNTVVVLWSDHGWHLGEKGISGKNTLWERSTRVPLIFAGPGVAKGAKCTQPAELLDIYPTLIDLCGLSPRNGLEGHSLMPQLKDAKTARPWPAITSHNQGNHTIRTEHMRYIRYADGSEELYDHRNDPNEWTNLAKDPKQAGVLKDLAKWLPKVDKPAAPNSAARVLIKENGVWIWEGKPIIPSELEK
jgi:choline-sulfatase